MYLYVHNQLKCCRGFRWSLADVGAAQDNLSIIFGDNTVSWLSKSSSTTYEHGDHATGGEGGVPLPSLPNIPHLPHVKQTLWAFFGWQRS